MVGNGVIYEDGRYLDSERLLEVERESDEEL